MSKERDYLINPEPYIEIEPLDIIAGLPDVYIFDHGATLYVLRGLTEDGNFIIDDWETGITRELYKNNKSQTFIVPEVLESLFTDLRVIHRLERIGPSIFRYKSGT